MPGLKYLVVGLGNIGQKRQSILGQRCFATVDPQVAGATYKSHVDAPLNAFDAVVLSIPTDLKLEFTEHFLSLGKHVLVEKPLVFPDDCTSGRFDHLAKQSGATWYTSYNHRFEPHILRLKELLDQNAIGEIYRAHLRYGNGTVQNCIGTWREGGYGMLEELGCHLIDLTGFLLGYDCPEYLVADLRSVESQSIDYGLFYTHDRRTVVEFGSIFWKNNFSIDIIGKTGSLHLNGLCKWGPSELTIRQRVYPSGVPTETTEVVEGPDPTWALDIEHFESRVKEGRTSLLNDIRISKAIRSIAQFQQTKTYSVNLSRPVDY